MALYRVAYQVESGQWTVEELADMETEKVVSTQVVPTALFCGANIAFITNNVGQRKGYAYVRADGITAGLADSMGRLP